MPSKKTIPREIQLTPMPPKEKRFLRIISALFGAALGVGVVLLSLRIIDNFVTSFSLHTSIEIALYVGAALIGATLFFFFGPWLLDKLRMFSKHLEQRLADMSLSAIISIVIGCILGLLVAFLLSPLINTILPTKFLSGPILIVLYILCSWLGITVGRARNWLELGASNKRMGRAARAISAQNSAPPKLLDTSVVIDGRIFDIIKTGFIDGPLVVPEFVLAELQRIADSSDAIKRARGRRGLDIIMQIQSEWPGMITIEETDFPEVAEVDVKLLRLGQQLDGLIVTNDYNLNKVAEVTGVKVLNINELSNAVKPMLLPGEEMLVHILREGKEASQGVAYLEDGTMIVIENGRGHIGQTVDVVVTSVLQTAAGRMIFTKLKNFGTRAG